ncbi:MAG: RIO kinase 2 [Methanohalophilus sp. T328-1]|nr:MAG: RIO kinase 2 [Methanohalophilus sp. T328-1]
MIADVLRLFPGITSRDFRILTGIEVGMQDHEWVPFDELVKYTRIDHQNLAYLLGELIEKELVVATTRPYEGYRLYFNGYDALAINALVKRGSICALGDEIGVGKESVVHEGMKEPELPIGDPETVIVKFHREGRTSFRDVKRVRGHLVNKEHFSWIYAARLAAGREYEIMSRLYPDISIPKPIDRNRHAIVMEPAKGELLFKVRLQDPEIFFDMIMEQVENIYCHNVIHADLSEYNIFVNPKGVQIIDWPQYVTPSHPHAEELLMRDISNIAAHFKKKYNLKRDVDALYGQIVSSTDNIKD